MIFCMDKWNPKFHWRNLVATKNVIPLVFHFLFVITSCVFEKMSHWWLIANESQERKRNKLLSAIGKLGTLVNFEHLFKCLNCCDKLWVDWYFKFYIVVIFFFLQLNNYVCWILHPEVPVCLSMLPKSKMAGAMVVYPLTTSDTNFPL